MVDLLRDHGDHNRGPVNSPVVNLHVSPSPLLHPETHLSVYIKKYCFLWLLQITGKAMLRF